MTYFLPTSFGSHDLKVGGEWLDDAQLTENTGESGDVYYQDLGGKSDQVQLFNFGDPSTLGSAWTGADNRNRREALFIQDRWSATSRVTLTAGVRYDRQRPYYEPSTLKPTLSDVFPAGSIPGATLLVRSTISPRIGVSFDPSGKTKSAVKAFYGRYYNNLASGFRQPESGRHRIADVSVQRPERQQSVRWKAGTRRARRHHRRNDDDARSQPEGAAHRRVRPLLPASVLGRVVGARSVCPQDGPRHLRELQHRARRAIHGAFRRQRPAAQHRRRHPGHAGLQRVRHSSVAARRRPEPVHEHPRLGGRRLVQLRYLRARIQQAVLGRPVPRQQLRLSASRRAAVQQRELERVRHRSARHRLFSERVSRRSRTDRQARRGKRTSRAGTSSRMPSASARTFKSRAAGRGRV